MPNLHIETQSDIHLSLGDSGDLGLSVGKELVEVQVDEYEGEYSFTPSEETQTAETEGLKLLHNITVAPIPSNYGRIAYSGSGIMVY